MPEPGRVREAVERHEGPLLAYVARFTGAERARDIVQEAFLKLCQQDVPPERVKPWLYATCRNRAIDGLRKEKRMTALASDVDVPAREASPIEVIETREASDGVLRELAKLTALQQEAVRLKFHSQFSYREIAEVMDVSVSHVGVLLHEAIKTLKTTLTR